MNIVCRAMKTRNPSEKVFYVYALLDPRKPGDFKYQGISFGYEPFYIGKGKSGRSAFHVSYALRSADRSHKLNKIRKIIDSGMEVYVVRFAEGLVEDDAIALEISTIAAIGRECLGAGPLTNLTEGGDGISGMRFTDGQRETLSLSQKRRFSSRTDEQKREWSEICKEVSARDSVKKLRSENTKRAFEENPDLRISASNRVKKMWNGLDAAARKNFVESRAQIARDRSKAEKLRIAEKKRATHAGKSAQEKAESALRRAEGQRVRAERERRKRVSPELMEKILRYSETANASASVVAREFSISRDDARKILANEFYKI